MVDWIPMQMLPPGQSGAVRQVFGAPEAVHRFEELGLRFGATVEMVRLGSPCIIRLAARELCFRSDEVKVLVQMGAAS